MVAEEVRSHDKSGLSTSNVETHMAYGHDLMRRTLEGLAVRKQGGSWVTILPYALAEFIGFDGHSASLLQLGVANNAGFSVHYSLGI